MSKFKPKLSKGILEMKFMKRTKDKVTKEDEEAEGRSMYSNETTKEMLNGSSNYITEPSFSNCENFIDGRFSFGGINPEIERLMELEEIDKEAKKRGAMETDVPDKDMARHYSQNLPKPHNKKFVSKKRRNNDQITNYKKTKFIRPRDDDDN